MKTMKEEFELEFERLKKETHQMFGRLFEKFTNVRDWQIDFEYDWSMNSSSSINAECNGWYDKLIEKEGEE